MRARTIYGMVLAAAGLLACAGRTAPPAAPTPAPPPDAPLPSVEWIPDGAGLLVDGRYLFEPATGRFAALDVPEGFYALSFSPSGRQLLVSSEGELRIGAPGAPFGPAVAVPSRLSPPAPEGERRVFAAWLSEREIYVAEWWTDAELHEACQVLDVKAGAWRTPAGCIEADFYQPFRLDLGPGGLVAVYSSGEGHPGVRVLRYDPARGSEEIIAPSFDLYPFGPLWIQLPRAVGPALIATPCDLSRERPCQESEEDGPTRLYSFTPGERGVKLLREGLPPFARPSPNGKLLAWPRPGLVCVGDPDSPDETICAAPPAEERGDKT
jgi:hypothetical protein